MAEQVEQQENQTPALSALDQLKLSVNAAVTAFHELQPDIPRSETLNTLRTALKAMDVHMKNVIRNEHDLYAVLFEARGYILDGCEPGTARQEVVSDIHSLFRTNGFLVEVKEVRNAG